MAIVSDELVRIVRALIGDLGTTQTYTDDRIREITTVAAQLVIGDVTFNNSYTIRVLPRTIDPDPTDSATREEVFINLVALKSACIVDEGAYRLKAGKAGVQIIHDRNRIDTKGHLEGYAFLIKNGPCAAYKEAKQEYEIDQTSVFGEAIMSPFKSVDGYPFSGGNIIWQT